MPAALDAERFVLGALLIDATAWPRISATLKPAHFFLEKHKLIYRCLEDLAARGESLDRVMLAYELEKRGELKKVDGLSYLVSLDEGMPQLYNIESYAGIVVETALQRRIITEAAELTTRAMGQEGSAAEVAAAGAAKLLAIARAQTYGSDLTPIGDVIREDPGRIVEPERHQAGLKTGFTRFDEMTGGLREGELWILAARPAMGKTALALNIATHVACHPKTPKAVAVFSLEMSKDSLITRMACGLARIDQQRHRAGYRNPHEREALRDALAKLEAAPLYIDDTAGVNGMDVYSKCVRLQQRGADLGLVIIDYLQLMQGRGRFENRVQEISSLSRGFKILSKELRCPVLALSQLSRAPEQRQGDHRPQLSDLRESGSIEQDADGVGFIFREEVYRPDKESLKGIAELILAKQRNGPTGRIKLAFLNRYTKFEDLADDRADEDPPPLARQDQPTPDPWYPAGGGLFTPRNMFDEEGEE